MRKVFRDAVNSIYIRVETISFERDSLSVLFKNVFLCTIEKSTNLVFLLCNRKQKNRTGSTQKMPWQKEKRERKRKIG